MTKNELNTFWSLINEHRIEIPIIQRDYVQGREDSKATQIRKGFVKSIIAALENEKPLHLEFIYGKINGKLDSYKVETNKKAILSLLKSVQDYSDNLNIGFNYSLQEHHKANTANTYFIPLDGQQRLTTLYLFHWYLCNRLEYDYEEELIRFSYKTRRSSKDFCAGLVKHKVRLDGVDEISKIIKDSTWFYNYWKRDPTIQSMLNMLDEIHNKLKSTDKAVLEKHWIGLSENNIITFEFLDLDKFELTDDLYVKMNARGKALSDFENFKSWIQAYVKKNKWEIENGEWHKHLDIEWLDIFWQYKDSGTYSIDKQYLTFFRLMMLFQYTETVQVKNAKIDDDSRNVIDTLRSDEFLPFSFIEKLPSFNQENLNQIFRVFQSLQEDGLEVLQNVINRLSTNRFSDPIEKLFSNNNATINLWDRVYAYAVTKFLIKKNKNLGTFNNDEKEQLFQWIRVCRNLIFNVAIDSPADFAQSIHQINKLAEYLETSLDFYSYFSDEDRVDSISFFSKNQIIEEEFKANAILNDHRWEDDLIEFENHEYFYGSIRFLLYYSKQDDSYSNELFRNYAAKASILFNSKILNHKNFILQRALLVKGDYLIEVGNNRSFCLSNSGTLRLREENWRKIFNDNEKRTLLQQLLDDVDIGKEKESLRRIIKDAGIPRDDWRYYFVNTSKLIEYAKKMQIRFWDKNVYILNASGSCKNVELHSYWHHIKKAETLKPDISEYHPVVGYSEEPYEEIQMTIKRTRIIVELNRNHESGFYEMEISAFKNYSREIKEFFTNQKFNLEENIYTKTIKTLTAIDKVISGLKNLN